MSSGALVKKKAGAVSALDALSPNQNC